MSQAPRKPRRRASRARETEQVSAQDRHLFRDAVGPVLALPTSRRRRPHRELPSARPLLTEADEQTVIGELMDDPPVDIETGDNLSYHREGVQLAVLRKLRRGHYRCQAEIDLHGMVVDVARHQLAIFLRDALDRGYRCVRIVHGKGLRSGNRGPVLKTRVDGWLRQRDEVLAFCSAPATDGGTGAIYALLKRP